MQTRNFLLVSAILLLTGSLFAGVAAYLYFQQANLEKNGLQTEGIVIALVDSSDSDGTTYAPVYQFKTRSGRVFEVQSNNYSNPPAYTLGQRVTVLYLPESPTQAQIKGEGWLLMVIFGAVGGLDLFLTLIFMIVTLFKNLQGGEDPNATA
jgi:hypothetical protein